MGVASDAAISAALANSYSMDKYKDAVDPESAMELLEKRIVEEEAARVAAEKQAELEKQAAKEQERLAKELEKQIAAEQKAAEKEAERRAKEAQKEADRQRKRREATIDQIVRTAGRTITREITRGIFGVRR